MENAALMKKAAKSKSAPASHHGETPRSWLDRAMVGDVLAVVFGLLFLFQCMALPLVGKAAMGGSGSPGAGPAETVWKNILFFTVMMLVMLATGAAAFYSKWMRRQREGGPFPKATAGLLAVGVLWLLVFATGLLKI